MKESSIRITDTASAVAYLTEVDAIPCGEWVEEKGAWRDLISCHRCGGAGGRECWPGFTCFECGGDTRKTVQWYEAVSTARKHKARMARQKRKQKAREATARDGKAWALENGLAALWTPMSDLEPRAVTHLMDLRCTVQTWGSLTDKQLAWAKRLLTQVKKDPIEVGMEPGDKVTVQGEVTSKEWREGDYGSQCFIKVRTEVGFVACFTTTAQSMTALSVGDDATIQATVSKVGPEGRWVAFKRPKSVSK